MSDRHFSQTAAATLHSPNYKIKINYKFWSGQGKSILDDVLTILSWLKIVAQPAQTEYNPSQQRNNTELVTAKKFYSLAPCIGSPNWPTVPRPGTERLRCVRPTDDVRCHSTIGACAACLFVYPCWSPDHIVTVSASPRKAREFFIAISWHIAQPSSILSGWCTGNGFLLRETARSL
jgi:hypothetical protein